MEQAARDALQSVQTNVEAVVILPREIVNALRVRSFAGFVDWLGCGWESTELRLREGRYGGGAISFPEYSVTPRVEPANSVMVPWSALKGMFVAGFEVPQ